MRPAGPMNTRKENPEMSRLPDTPRNAQLRHLPASLLFTGDACVLDLNFPPNCKFVSSLLLRLTRVWNECESCWDLFRKKISTTQNFFQECLCRDHSSLSEYQSSMTTCSTGEWANGQHLTEQNIRLKTNQNINKCIFYANLVLFFPVPKMISFLVVVRHRYPTKRS